MKEHHATKPTTDYQIQVLENKITLLEDLLKDGAGPMKAYPLPTARPTYLSQLSDIDNQNPGVTEDILPKVRSLHLKALGKSNLQAIMDTMQELMDDHPKEYAEALQYIDRTHDFLFDSMQEGHI